MSVRVWHRRAGQKTFTWGKTLTKLQLKISRRENESKPARNRKQSWTRFFLHNRNKYTLEEPKNRDVKEKLSKHPHHHRYGNKPSPEESLEPNEGSRPHQLHVPLPCPDPTTTLTQLDPLTFQCWQAKNWRFDFLQHLTTDEPSPWWKRSGEKQGWGDVTKLF